MSTEKPVVFLAFANAPDDHLDNLKTESREVFRALQSLQADGRIQVHREESSQIDELYEDLLAYDDRVVIFHYGGHADGASLRLEGGDGGAKGLAGLLGQQSSLKLVFLNGCATQGHVRHLISSGVPAVIATSVPIGDRKALEFSVAFYNALAKGRSVRDSFESGRALVEGKHGESIHLGGVITRSGSDWDEEDEEEDYESPVLEWALYEQEEKTGDLDEWRLPDAQSDWLVQLNDADGAVRQLDGAAYVLQHRAPTRTVEAAACNNCGANVMHAESQNCAVCGSGDVTDAAVRTGLAEQVVPFAISEDEAFSQARSVAGEKTASIELQSVLVPYWSISSKVRGEFSGDRGVIKDFTSETPAPKWESVKDKVDLSMDDSLVKASSAPTGRAVPSREWYWELDKAVPIGSADADAQTSVSLDRSLQSAFDEVAPQLKSELEAEVIERVGGLQQRNISIDTRYRDIAARSVLLPHWYARIEQESGETGIVINGQTGAVRALNAPGLAQLPDGVEETMSKRTFESGSAGESSSYSASVFAGVGIGLMVGLLLGLSAPSAKSVVGVFIGAVGVALAALLGLNDKHFSTAKGLRIGSFGLAVVLAAPVGIYARDHGIFSPTIEERVAEITALHFTKEQALQFLVAMEANKSGDGEANVASLSRHGSSALFASDGQISTCGTLERMSGSDETASFDEVHGYFNTTEPDWGKLADAAGSRFAGEDRKRVLFIARDAVCEIVDFVPTFRPSAADCKAVAEMSAFDVASMPSLMQTLGQRVEKDISADARTEAMKLVAETVCSPN